MPVRDAEFFSQSKSKRSQGLPGRAILAVQGPHTHNCCLPLRLARLGSSHAGAQQSCCNHFGEFPTPIAALPHKHDSEPTRWNAGCCVSCFLETANSSILDTFASSFFPPLSFSAQLAQAARILLAESTASPRWTVTGHHPGPVAGHTAQNRLNIPSPHPSTPCRPFCSKDCNDHARSKTTGSLLSRAPTCFPPPAPDMCGALPPPAATGPGQVEVSIPQRRRKVWASRRWSRPYPHYTSRISTLS